MNRYSLGLIGYPLSHSLSPKLHHAALKAAGLEGEYRLFPIAPGEAGELKQQLEKVRAGEMQGLNVTIPYKQTIIPYLDELTPTARAVGAVNTIYFRDNKLTGDNTDAPGFLSDLKRFLGGSLKTEAGPTLSAAPRRQSALIFGAGGSARAVVYALLQDGWHITLVARRLEQAQTLANAYPLSPISNIQYPITQLPDAPITLIVNTTPLGMTPLIDTSPWPAALPFPENAAVYDLVYNPQTTVLVHTARAAGLPATTGLGMLIEQAALAFEIWTGRGADRGGMRNAVR